MSNRVISIKRSGNVNNVFYRDVLIGAYEDGDSEMSSIIIDKCIDHCLERNENKEQLIQGVLEIYKLGYEHGRKGMKSQQGLLPTIIRSLFGG